jgi:hypothetical protein
MADAHAGLISILASKPEFDAEVDRSLAEMRKLDPSMAKAAAIEITLRRDERALYSRKGRSGKTGAD